MINQIRAKIVRGAFEFSKHAVDQTILRGITVDELREAIANGEIIENYPNDKYGASCLIFGKTKAGRAIHVQCSHPTREIIKVITVYEPDPNLWLDLRQRVKTK
jgi:hypothetical protein